LLAVDLVSSLNRIFVTQLALHFIKNMFPTSRYPKITESSVFGLAFDRASLFCLMENEKLKAASLIDVHAKRNKK
jgi:hypothetical protein